MRTLRFAAVVVLSLLSAHVMAQSVVSEDVGETSKSAALPAEAMAGALSTQGALDETSKSDGAPTESSDRYQIDVRWSPNPPVLGRDAEVLVTVQVSDHRGNPVPDARLRLTASTGTFVDTQSLGDGRYVTAFIPANVRFPHVCIVSIQVLSHPASSLFFTIPLHGLSRFPVDGKPGMPLELELGGRTFGPFVADDEGVAIIEAEVPPGVLNGRLISRRLGRPDLAQSVVLPAIDYSRMMILPLAPMVADGRSHALVQFLVIDEVGQPLEGARVTLSATLGVVTTPVDMGDGIYRARYSPPRMTDVPRKDTLIARLRDSASPQEDRVKVELLPTPSTPASGPDQGAVQNMEAGTAPRSGPAEAAPPAQTMGSTASLSATANVDVPAFPRVRARTSLDNVGIPWSPKVEQSSNLEPMEEEEGERTLEGRLFPLLGGGYYYFSQTSLGEEGPFPDGTWVIPAATTAAGMGLDLWYGDRFGASMRYVSAYYRFAMPSVSLEPLADLKQLLTLDGRLRFPWKSALLRGTMGGRLGVSYQDHPSFEADPDGTVHFIDNHGLATLQGAVDLQLMPSERLEFWGTYGLGLEAVGWSLTNQHGEVGGMYRLLEGLSAGLSAEVWRRKMAALRASDGTPTGTLSDTWIQAWAFLAIHY